MPEPYQPDYEAARLAPAAVCNVASRVLWLRQLMAKKPELFSVPVREALKPFIAPLPFEAELLSGRMDLVDAAIKKIGV